MTSRSTWTGGVRWLAAVLLVAVLSLGPGVDAIICGNDIGLSSAAAVAPAVAGQTMSAPHDHQLGSDGADVCIHGHCHHNGPFVPSQNAGDLMVREARAEHAAERATVRASDLHFALKRPPRA